jgi:pilus assembly protein CpaC
MHQTHVIWRTALGLAVSAWIAAGPGRELRAADQPLPPPLMRADAAPKGNAITIAIGSSQRLQMKGHKVIKSVVNPKENVAFVQPVQDDPRTVLITGRDAGVTRITLTAADDSEESYEVVVQFDVEFLRTLLARAVPTANIQLIPAASGVLIISGNVNHADDIDIIMRTAQSVVSQPDRVINALRIGGVVQVQLDCVVAFVSRTELRRMSFDFLNAGHHHNFSSTVGGALINPNLGSTLPSIPGVDLPIENVITSPNGAPANIFLGLFNDQQVFFGLLQALRDDRLIKILAEPKLVTMSGRSANLLSGGQQAIPESAGLGSISVRFEPFGTQLSVLPVVLGNGRIHLEVEPEVSNIDPTVGTTIQGTSVPGRSTQRVHTTVEMQEGQTLAIGGLIQNTVTANTTKLPVLGELPFIGAAFSAKSFQETEEELVVLVTPHVVDALACNQVPKLLPGQETRSPDDFELFLEGIMEAPRGQREVCPDDHYLPAFKNGPTAAVYPCGDAGCGGGKCGGGNCVNCLRNGSELPADGPAKPVDSPWGTGDAGAGKPGAVTKEGQPFVLPTTVEPSSTDNNNK